MLDGLKDEIVGVKDELKKLNLLLSKLVDQNKLDDEKEGEEKINELRQDDIENTELKEDEDDNEISEIKEDNNEEKGDDINDDDTELDGDGDDDDEIIEEEKVDGDNKEAIKSEEKKGEDESSVLSRLTGFVTKLLTENRPRERLSKEDALGLLQEMGFADADLNADVLKESSSLQEAVCRLLDK